MTETRQYHHVTRRPGTHPSSSSSSSSLCFLISLILSFLVFLSPLLSIRVKKKIISGHVKVEVKKEKISYICLQYFLQRENRNKTSQRQSRVRRESRRGQRGKRNRNSSRKKERRKWKRNNRREKKGEVKEEQPKKKEKERKRNNRRGKKGGNGRGVTREEGEVAAPKA